MIHVCDNVWFQKYPYSPPTEGHWRFLGGGGGLKSQTFRKKHEAIREFSGGVRGCKTKNFPWGEDGYFLELHNVIL